MSQPPQTLPRIRERLQSIWHRVHKKGKLRQVLGQRILATISAKPQNLKDQFLTPLLMPVLLLLTTGGTQSDLEKFQPEDGPTITAPDEPDSTGGINKKETESPSDPEGGNSGANDGEDNPPQGVIYARVSSGSQLDGNSEDEGDEGSIDGQISELEDLAENNGIDLPYDPITDKAETGTNFDRDGIQEVFEVAKQERIKFLLVEKIDRIGRSAPETLYFIYILQSECGVTLLTPAGEQDIGQVRGLLHTTLMSLMAEVQNEIRTGKAKKERIRGFLEKKNWKCYSPKIPLGYTENDDGWLDVDPTEKRIIRDLFKKFVECGQYAETERYIDEKYGRDVLNGHSVKTLLRESTYIGKPELPESWLVETTYENNLESPRLNLLEKEEGAEIDICEEVFHQAQGIIEEKNQKYSSDEDTRDLLDFLEEFSLFAVVEGTDPAALLHHCGEPLKKDGQVDLKGNKIHRYRCPKCEVSDDAEEYYRQWPREHELDAIKLIQEVLDGETDLFDITE